MPQPESARRKCGLCSPDKKWPASRRKTATVRAAADEHDDTDNDKGATH